MVGFQLFELPLRPRSPAGSPASKCGDDEHDGEGSVSSAASIDSGPGIATVRRDRPDRGHWDGTPCRARPDRLDQTAAGCPSFIGRPVMVSLVPTRKSLGRMPLRIEVIGPSASKHQVVTEPSLLVTSTSSQECGLIY